MIGMGGLLGVLLKHFAVKARQRDQELRGYDKIGAFDKGIVSGGEQQNSVKPRIESYPNPDGTRSWYVVGKEYQPKDLPFTLHVIGYGMSMYSAWYDYKNAARRHELKG